MAVTNSNKMLKKIFRLEVFFLKAAVQNVKENYDTFSFLTIIYRVKCNKVKFVYVLIA